MNQRSKFGHLLVGAFLPRNLPRQFPYTADMVPVVPGVFFKKLCLDLLGDTGYQVR